MADLKPLGNYRTARRCFSIAFEECFPMAPFFSSNVTSSEKKLMELNALMGFG